MSSHTPTNEDRLVPNLDFSEEEDPSMDLDSENDTSSEAAATETPIISSIPNLPSVLSWPPILPAAIPPVLPSQPMGEPSLPARGIPVEPPQEMNWMVARRFREVSEDTYNLRMRVTTDNHNIRVQMNRQGQAMEEYSERTNYLHYQVASNSEGVNEARAAAYETRETFYQFVALSMFIGGVALTIIMGLVLAMVWRN